jgi:hypothetical protein
MRLPFLSIVRTVKGSVLHTVFVTLNNFARPPGPRIIAILKMSGWLGTTEKKNFITTPLLFITAGYDVPAVALSMPIGTTNSMRPELTDFRPAAAPFIVIVTPLNSIGSVNLRSVDPTAVRGVIGGAWSAG